MPPKVIVATPAEVTCAAIDTLRETAQEIERLGETPLGPNETIDDRVRKIALKGEVMARTFLIFDSVVLATLDERIANAPKPEPEAPKTVDPNSN